MKLILFIGHHKVGSSALQTYLARNALPLLRRGILYPAVEGQGMATLLAMAIKGQDAPESPLPVNFREAHNALAFAMLSAQDGRPLPALHEGLPPAEAMLTTILRQIEVFDPHTVILAAEVFANFAAVSPSLITALADHFAGAEIHLTATLRQVDDYLVSWHGQRLRFGQTPKSLPGGALQRYYSTIHFDYRSMLEGWITGLPDATLRLRAYDEVLATGGAVQDFLAAYGIDPVPGHPVEPRVNTSLHRGLLEIARQANYKLGAADKHEMFHLLLALGRKLDLPPAAEIEMFGAAARTDMATRFAPLQDWLSGVAGRPFLGDPAALTTLRPIPEHAVNVAALAQLRGAHLADFPAAAQDFLGNMTLPPNFT
jgi:hypothetical protein